MDSKIIAIIIATLILGGGVVVYQKTGGVAGLKQKITQKANEAVSNAKEQVNEQIQGQTGGGSLTDTIFKGVKDPKDFLSRAEEVGPYTCYLTITDKQTGQKHKMTVSSDGKMSYLYSSDEGTKSYGKVWVTKDAMYIESSDENGEVHNIKISGQAAASYQQAIGGVWYNEIKAMSDTSGESANASYQVKCYRNKVDIPHLDESKFKSFNFNMQQGAGVQGGSGATNGNFQMNMPDFKK